MSGASTLRNAVKRIAHKERSQPGDRKKFGLLEKHKDYVVRANDYKKKQKVIRTLRNKAAEKNPDEFYHHMHNSKVKDGVHTELSKNQITQEMLQLVQSQDVAYLLHKKAIDEHKINRLKEDIQLIGDVRPKTHKIFVNNEEELDSFDAAKHFDTLPELMERTHNRPRLSQLELEKEAFAAHKSVAALPLSPQLAIAEEEQKYLDKSKKRKLSPQLAEIKARDKRLKKIEEALQIVTAKKNATMKGHKVKVVVKKPMGRTGKEKELVVYKFKRERSR